MNSVGTPQSKQQLPKDETKPHHLTGLLAFLLPVFEVGFVPLFTHEDHEGG